MHFCTKNILLLLLCTFTCVFFSCGEDDSFRRVNPSSQINNRDDKNQSDGSKDENSEKVLTDLKTALVDYMTIGALEVYYLWIDDPGRVEKIESYLNPDTCVNPMVTIKKVLSEEDRWTSLVDNFNESIETLDGIETTIGADFTPWKLSDSEIIFTVNYVYNNSPAQQAGLKRGDIITRLNGKKFYISNYTDFYNQSGTMDLTLGVLDDNLIIEGDKSISVVPVKMSLDPIICTNVFDLETKKIGYLAYDNFTSDTKNLIDVMSKFKQQGVSELILDLRYNGGGYVSTSEVLASLLAPVDVVKNKEVFHRNVYNSLLSEVLSDDLEVHFSDSCVDCNPNLNKIYALVSKYTASASEGLLVGLSPFIDLTIIGEQTHGKFCSGLMLSPEEIFEKDFFETYKKELDDWGIYVMIGTFSDKNGENKSRPNGFIPDIKEQDNPFDGYQLGDENETMLRTALELAGKDYQNHNTRAASTFHLNNRIYEERPSLCIERKPKNLLRNLSHHKYSSTKR